MSLPWGVPLRHSLDPNVCTLFSVYYVQYTHELTMGLSLTLTLHMLFLNCIYMSAYNVACLIMYCTSATFSNNDFCLLV